MQLNLLKTKKARSAAILLLSVAMTLTWMDMTEKSQSHRALTEGGDTNLRSAANAHRSLKLNEIKHEMGLKEGSSFSDSGTLVSLITTPKTGTSTLTETFRRSWKCDQQEGETIAEYEFQCTKDRQLLRTHYYKDAVKAVEQKREENPDGKCLILSAIRSPRPWFASQYFQNIGCDAIRKMSDEELIRNFKRYMHMNFEDQFNKYNMLGLLEEFGGGKLSDLVKVMNQNGGYSVLSAASSESVFSGCKLLFLELEEAERWPDILKAVAPDVNFYTFPSRKDQCPDLINRYNWIQSYELSPEDKLALEGQHPVLADWFQAYEYDKVE